MAETIRYEYDLGMQTSCFQCGASLLEVDYVVRDRGDLFCSSKCMDEADGITPTEFSLLPCYWCQNIHKGVCVNAPYYIAEDK